MGWTISHGTGPGGRHHRSYRTIDELADALAYVLSSREWRVLAPVFDPASGDPFSVPPKTAGKCADLLDKAARHPLMSADWADLARTLAASARRASSAGQVWQWS